LMEVPLSGGRSLIATGDHKVFTWNKGWTPIVELNLLSRLEGVNSLALWNLVNRSCIKTTSTTFKSLVDTITETGTKTILSRSALCTGLFGQTTMARLKMASMSIIRMVTGAITASSTLNWLTRNLTPDTTYETDGRIQSFAGAPLPEFQTSSQSLGFGISRQKVAHSTGSRGKITGQSESQQPRHVMSVEKIFQHTSQRQEPALENALTSTLLGSILTDMRCVSSATKSLWQAATHSRCIVVSPARRLPCTKSEKVFDLTLLEHNAYYANGVLVANCGRSPDLFDALAIGIEGARQRGFTVNNDVARVSKKQESESWRNKIKEKAVSTWKAGTLDYSA
jgi:hypothetical protein